MQIIRYLAFVESWNQPTNSTTPFQDILIGNAAHGFGLLGFSSGIIPACVAASSSTTMDYVNHSTQMYRLVIWIGIRCQLYKVRNQSAQSHLPWSCVFFRLTKEEADKRISVLRLEIEVSASKVPS